jgi:hypothetical protein
MYTIRDKPIKIIVIIDKDNKYFHSANIMIYYSTLIIGRRKTRRYNLGKNLSQDELNQFIAFMRVKREIEAKR